MTLSFESDPLAIIQKRELATTLYEELAKLPETYQTPIVLCMLEGKSRSEASVELECTVASVKARLARGRQQLRRNLTRRGIAFSAALTAACSTANATEPTVSLCSKTAVACATYMFATEGSNIPPDIIQLSEEGMSVMTLATYSKLAIASLVLLAISVAGTTLPITGSGNAHAADGVIDIELKSARSPEGATLFTQSRQATAVAQRQKTTNPLENVYTDFFVGMDAPSASDVPIAAQNISEQASNEVVQALIEALEDSDQQVTHNAAKTLVSIGKGRKEVVLAFSKVAANAKDKKLRYFAVAGLGRIGGSSRDAAKSLTTIVQQDADPIFRKAAVEALGQLQMNDEVAKALATALKDSDTKVRATAAKALSRFRPRQNSVLETTVSEPKDLNVSIAPGVSVSSAP